MGPESGKQQRVKKNDLPCPPDHVRRCIESGGYCPNRFALLTPSPGEGGIESVTNIGAEGGIPMKPIDLLAFTHILPSLS